MFSVAARSFRAIHAEPIPAFDMGELSAAIDSESRLAGAALASHETYRTIELCGRPLATVSRPRLIGGDGLYMLALTDGRVVAAFDRSPTVRRCLEAVYSYARSVPPSDVTPEEAESYLASFADNWETALDSGVVATFRAAALTRCARWARRAALARETLAAAPQGEPEDAPQGEDDARPLPERLADLAALCAPVSARRVALYLARGGEPSDALAAVTERNGPRYARALSLSARPVALI